MNPKLILALVLSVILLIVFSLCFHGFVGHNDSQNWQVWQSLNGDVQVVDCPGWYGKWFGTIWTYPRTLEAYYSAHPGEGDKGDESIAATFNDGGRAKISSYVRVQLPADTDSRLLMHRDFQGNPANIAASIRAHLVNVITVSSPVMSASENQAARKAEFNQIIQQQLSKGVFAMRGTEIELADLTELEDAGVDAQGNKITRQKHARVKATEIIRDKDGNPIICEPSPLAHYHITPLQYSITNIDYDEQTLEQFAAKKKSYLAAEQAKAQRQEEVQQRLMIEEKGRRQVAEVQAEENQTKERATIQAHLASEVAVIAKSQAVTQASQRVEVANQARQEAETMKVIAKIEADTAELKKQAKISAAEAQQKSIELGGGISEEKRVLAEIQRDRDIQVAMALKDIQVPSTVIAGGDAGGGGALENLMQLYLLKNSGVIQERPEVSGQRTIKASSL